MSKARNNAAQSARKLASYVVRFALVFAVFASIAIVLSVLSVDGTSWILGGLTVLVLYYAFRMFTSIREILF